MEHLKKFGELNEISAKKGYKSSGAEAGGGGGGASTHISDSEIIEIPLKGNKSLKVEINSEQEIKEGWKKYLLWYVVDEDAEGRLQTDDFIELMRKTLSEYEWRMKNINQQVSGSGAPERKRDI